MNPLIALEDGLLSVVLRIHSRERLGFLDEALFSLAVQHWSPVEAIIAVQNGDSEFIADIDQLASRQPWNEGCRWRILPVEVDAGVDGRSILLNRGIEAAAGRYLAFLDDDDVVYPHGYQVLIGQLEAGTGAMAVGGCRWARVRRQSDHWYAERKYNDLPWGRTRFELFVKNFVAIHAYVIDRSKLNGFWLGFDESMTFLEDYDFLLRFCQQFDPDFSQIDLHVCEYRIREDGSNTVPHLEGASGESVTAIEQARQLLEERKNEMICSVSGSQMKELGMVIQNHQQLLRDRDRFMVRAALRVEAMLEQHPRLVAALRVPLSVKRRIMRALGKQRQP